MIDPLGAQVYSWVSAVLQFLMPSTVIAYCYWQVSARIRNRLVARSATRGMQTRRDRVSVVSQHAAAREQLELRRKRKTNLLLILMVCSAPHAKGQIYIFVSSTKVLSIYRLIYS